MALSKEQIDIDFFVDPTPLTKEDQQLISNYIKTDKQKRKHLRALKKGTHAQHQV